MTLMQNFKPITRRMIKMKKSLIITGLFATAVMLCGAEAKNKSKAPALPQMPVPTVLADTVVVRTNNETKKYIGMLKAHLDAVLVAKVSGTIDAQPVAHGSFVKKGDMIVHINDLVYQAQVQSAKALIAQTEAELKHAKSNLDRQKKLYSQKATSESTYEDAQKVYYTTLAKLDNYKAQLILAEDSLSDTRVCAPFDGRIGKVILSPGNSVTPGRELVRVVSLSPVNVDFSISSRDFLEMFGSMDALKAKGKAYIELADGSKYPGDGRIIYMSNSVDTNTDTIEIRASFDNPKGKLIPGGLVTVRLGLRTPPRMPSVPVSAVLNSKQGAFVYVIGKDKRAIRRAVTPGPVVGNYQFIAKGLKAGETVVSGGSNKVFPGMPVNPVFMKKAER